MLLSASEPHDKQTVSGCRSGLKLVDRMSSLKSGLPLRSGRVCLSVRVAGYRDCTAPAGRRSLPDAVRQIGGQRPISCRESPAAQTPRTG